LSIPQGPSRVTPSSRVYPTCTALRHGGWVDAQKHGCTCPESREALRIYRKRHREGRLVPRLVGTMGSRRRLRALMAIGHSEGDLASALGWTRRAVGGLVAGEHDLTRAAKAAAVSELYERLCGTAGDSQRSRSWAQRRGWAPPLAWNDIDDPAENPSAALGGNSGVDEVAVARACRKGISSVALTDEEAAEVRCRLVSSSLSAREVAVLLGVNVRSVDRWRSRPVSGAA
jgi:hypothetical protein